MPNKIENFYDLDAWKKAHELVLAIYEITEEFPKEEKYSLTSQIRRAVSSITANIAEGFSRYHFRDKTRFYYQARGSVAEVQSFLLLAKDLRYITTDDCQKMGEKASSVSKLINGLIRSIENQQN